MSPLSLSVLAFALAATPAAVPPPAPAGPVITLPEVLDRAEEGSTDLAVLRERLEQAEIGIGRAWGAFQPQVSVAGSYTRNSVEAVLPMADPAAGYTSVPLPSPPAPPGSLALIPNALIEVEIQPLHQWAAIAQVTQPILIMPAIVGIPSIGDTLEAAEKNLAHARTELVFGITQAYYATVATQRLVELSREQLRTATEQERVAKARYQAGELPKVGLLRTGVERARAEQDVRRAENGLAAAKLALATLAGLEQPFEVTPPPPVEAPAGAPEDLVLAAASARKDLQASNAALRVAERAVSVAWWKYAPVISANGQYRWTNVAGFTGEETSWLVSLTAAFTIWDGGSRWADVGEAHSKAREAAATREGLARRIAQEVKGSLLDLESAQANLLKAREQEKLALENVSLVQTQFAAGAATSLDVVDASTARYLAGFAVVAEELNVELASLKLSRAIGRFQVEGL